VLGVPAAGLAVLLLLGGWRPGMEVTTPYGLWSAVLLDSLYGCFAVAATIPLLPAVAGRMVTASATDAPSPSARPVPMAPVPAPDRPPRGRARPGRLRV